MTPENTLKQRFIKCWTSEFAVEWNMVKGPNPQSCSLCFLVNPGSIFLFMCFSNSFAIFLLWWTCHLLSSLLAVVLFKTPVILSIIVCNSSFLIWHILNSAFPPPCVPSPSGCSRASSSSLRGGTKQEFWCSHSSFSSRTSAFPAGCWSQILDMEFPVLILQRTIWGKGVSDAI